MMSTIILEFMKCQIAEDKMLNRIFISPTELRVYKVLEYKT